MRVSRVVAGVLMAPAAVAMIAVAVHTAPAGAVHGSRPPAAQVVPAAGQASGGGGTAGKSHTVAKMIAGHALYHLVPHAHVPYLLRPRLFRGPFLFRRRY